MKLKDILTKETYYKFGDMDVVDDVIDDFYPAWCGNVFTEEGKAHFAKALEIDAEIRPIWGMVGIMCKIDGPDWKEKRKLLMELFDSLCGYCSCEEYDRWFCDEVWDEPEETCDDVNSMLKKAITYIIDHTPVDQFRNVLCKELRIREEDIIPYLESIGFNVSLIKED